MEIVKSNGFYETKNNIHFYVKISYRYYTNLNDGFGSFLLFNFTIYQIFSLVSFYMMVSVWFNDYGYQQAMLISFAYLLQFSCFVLYTLALTLTIEDALNKLQDLESRLKTVLGKNSSTQ